MLGRGLWLWKGRFGKRRCTAVSVLCAAVPCACLLALLFVDAIESWTMSLAMNKAGAEQGGGGTHSSPQGKLEEYPLMPSPLVCQRANPYLLTIVTTAPANLKAREAIRNTWGGETEVRGRRVMTLFMVGLTVDPVLSKQLVQEAQDHRDLIQGRFVDTYANLTLKTLSMLGWTRRFCLQTRFIAKVDDDVLFNPGMLLRYLNRSHSTVGDLYLGRVHLKVLPNRNPASKHYLPATAYAPEVFPDYCSGTAYVLSLSAALKISQAAPSLSAPVPLPPEDVFVGLTARAAGVLPSHCPLFSGGPGMPYSRCCYQAMVSVHHISPREMIRIWGEVHSPPPCSWFSMRVSLGLCKVRALLGTMLGVDEGV
ncbi:putative UDP-GlcNAc:betaGal beta-1,3-N-acetylglucosaminyltransferase LOC100288842 [Megalops cyprinoides]|uniref:putative UDP-GlcNAc:betaGal beta-1,3-N-acetylglucosaminyltransferase LOC100288842 n=1 Tax=Megalops cyprinoides TaxID=118141 RepID=UPI001864CE24|nr:putative UDP-GlcNAc:betaGal beta-1,3-N-acetylglucosaminyltransferase LOC100288842 [Megalops cyprinoides]XP_036390013.1 putative UDP-GlcNAc:betaGal beta-1,3-N-acetylglucosaminyltransferase LOC100288842 [Megalops cyprinoides]